MGFSLDELGIFLGEACVGWVELFGLGWVGLVGLG